jgi:hypothetical protein
LNIHNDWVGGWITEKLGLGLSLAIKWLDLSGGQIKKKKYFKNV